MKFLKEELIVDPYPTYARWQQDHPIWRAEDTGNWVLTRHDDVRSVLKNSADYSSKAMGEQGNPLPLLTDDPPTHTQLRKLVDRAFTNRMLKLMETWVESLAEEMVADLPVHEPVDIVQALTVPLPVAVISRMMGIPVERAEDFKRWSDALTGTLAGVSPEARMQDIMEMAAFFQSLIPERRENPGEDLVSAVVNAEIEGERLTDEQIVGFNILLLIAGNETTSNLLGNLLNIAADQPGIWSQLVSDPSLIDAAVEETLRYDAPVQFLMRKAIRPMNYYGQEESPPHIRVWHSLLHRCASGTNGSQTRAACATQTIPRSAPPAAPARRERTGGIPAVEGISPPLAGVQNPKSSVGRARTFSHWI
jgi:cytochrome P450